MITIDISGTVHPVESDLFLTGLPAAMEEDVEGGIYSMD